MFKHRATRGEAGFSLVEVLVVVMLIATVLLAAAAGMLVIIKASSATENRQKAEMALSSAVEQLGTRAYIPCATTASYRPPSAAEVNLPAGSTVTITEVEYWTGSIYGPPPCTTDRGAQRLKVEVVFKRSPTDAQPLAPIYGELVLRNPNRA